MNTIIRTVKDRHHQYTMINRIPLNDSRLSWEARGVLAYLLDKPDDWEVRFQDLVNKGPGEADRMRRILKELQETGYMRRERVQADGGRFAWITVIYETPELAAATPCAGFPYMEKPSMENPFTENRHIYSSRNGLNTDVTNTESTPAPGAASDVSRHTPNSASPTSNGSHLGGYDPPPVPPLKGARPVAAEEPPPVVVKVPPRRPGQALTPGEPGTPPRQPRPRKAPLPEGWVPDAVYAQRAVDEYPQLTDAQRADALKQFRLHYEANGEPYANWGAKYLEWLHHEVHTYARAPGKSGAAPSGDKAPPTYFTADPYGGRRR